MRAHRLASDEGFSASAAGALAIAVSELARNILVHAGVGEVRLEVVDEGARSGILAVACDEGPGVADVEQAMQDGYSTSGTLGLGLSSVHRLVDDLQIVTSASGTRVTITKWRRST